MLQKHNTISSILSNPSETILFRMAKIQKFRDFFFRLSFTSLGWKRNQKIKPTVSAAAQARTPKLSAWPHTHRLSFVQSNRTAGLGRKRNSSAVIPAN